MKGSTNVKYFILINIKPLIIIKNCLKRLILIYLVLYKNADKLDKELIENQKFFDSISSPDKTRNIVRSVTRMSNKKLSNWTPLNPIFEGKAINLNTYFDWNKNFKYLIVNRCT